MSNKPDTAKPSDPETEVTFLRSQVISLQNRLCETLSQQVAQQQTVLIAAMQTNLALTQTVDKVNRIADTLAELLDKREEARAEDGAETRSDASANFSSVLATLMPYLLSGAGGASHPKPSAEAPAPAANPFTVIHKYGTPTEAAPGAASQPVQEAAVPTTVTTVLKPRADGMGYEEHIRTETKRPFPGPGLTPYPSTTISNPAPEAPSGKAQTKKPNPKEPKP
jgi:hypothetical protein